MVGTTTGGGGAVLITIGDATIADDQRDLRVTPPIVTTLVVVVSILTTAATDTVVQRSGILRRRIVTTISVPPRRNGRPGVTATMLLVRNDIVGIGKRTVMVNDVENGATMIREMNLGVEADAARMMKRTTAGENIHKNAMIPTTAGRIASTGVKRSTVDGTIVIKTARTRGDAKRGGINDTDPKETTIGANGNINHETVMMMIVNIAAAEKRTTIHVEAKAVIVVEKWTATTKITPAVVIVVTR